MLTSSDEDGIQLIRVFLSHFPANVVSEDAILKWFKDGHSQKGKMHFLEQMKKFIEWLQSAEEGKYFIRMLFLFCKP